MLSSATAHPFADGKRHGENKKSIQRRTTHVHLPEQAGDTIVAGEVEYPDIRRALPQNRKCGEREPDCQSGHKPRQGSVRSFHFDAHWDKH